MKLHSKRISILHVLTITVGLGALQRETDQGAPAGGVDVGRLAVDPLIIPVLPTVEMNAQQATQHLGNGGHANQSVNSVS